MGYDLKKKFQMLFSKSQTENRKQVSIFTRQIIRNSLYQNAQPNTFFETDDRAFQRLHQAFEALRENRRHGQNFKKLSHVFVR